MKFFCLGHWLIAVFIHVVFRTDCDTREKSCGFPIANLSLVSSNQEVSMFGMLLSCFVQIIIN